MLIQSVYRQEPFGLDDRPKVTYTLKDLQQVALYVHITKNRYKDMRLYPWRINGKKMLKQEARQALKKIHKKISKELRVAI